MIWIVGGLILVALIFDYINGFHDAANSIATIVSTRVLRPSYAVVWAAFFNFIAFAIFGALSAVWLRGFSNDIYFQIGMVTLIGLSAKNAILIVEFANTRYEAGMPLLDAAIEAARLRFRPIIMTSMAFIFGMFPLVIATGAGAASRQSIGTGVLGGMLAATFLAIFFVPLFYVLIRKVTGRPVVASHEVRQAPPVPKGEV